MFSWRDYVGNIRRIVAGSPPEDWRSNFIEIARSNGHNPRDWREAIIIWASDFGVITDNWRSSLSEIARALGSPTPLAWRNALRYIADNLAPVIEPRELFDRYGRKLFDNAGRELFSRG